jgi:HEAT repeat protein
MQAFLAAVARGDDEEAERCALQLTAGDEPALVTMAVSPDLDTRWWGVRGLAQIGGAAGVPVVRDNLQDADGGVRAAAALALGYLYARVPDEVTPTLDEVAALLSDNEGIVRQAAADGLALCGDGAVAALGRILRNSTHQGARTRAAGALRKIATVKAAAILYPLLNDSNHLVRMYAYEGLDEMGLLETVLLVP